MIHSAWKKQKENENETQKYGNVSGNLQDLEQSARNSMVSDELLLRRRRKKRSTNNISHNRVPGTIVADDYTEQDQSKQCRSENQSSESEFLSDGDNQTRSLALKIRLNPMDFEYFTSVVRSEDELANKWEATSSNDDVAESRTQINEQPSNVSHSSASIWKSTWQDMVDDRIKAVFDCSISQFESSFLIIQLLLALQDQEMPNESNLAIHVLKFALDTLWSLQFTNASANFSNIECATLKTATARLMLVSLERTLQGDEPTTAVIQNGLLPMSLRLLEDACSKSIPNATVDEVGSLLQEFIFAMIHGIITFLYFLIRQRKTTEKFEDFLELFQLFTESLEGKLIERTIFTIIELPNTDRNKSFNRARKIIDMIGVLMSGLKRTREQLSHVNHCRRPKHKTCVNEDTLDTHHHSDILGDPYYSKTTHVLTARASLSKPICSISSLFSTLTCLLKESNSFSNELQVRLIQVMAVTGTCCCFSPKFLLASISTFLAKGSVQSYGPAFTLIERTIFKELGGYESNEEMCNVCCALDKNGWDFLELYIELLNPENPKLCQVTMMHLLRVTPKSTFAVKQELLFRVFYPTFLKTKTLFETSKAEFSSLKFLIQSCLSAITSLIANTSMFRRFIELDGLKEALSMLPNQAFVKSAYSLLEISVIMEIKSVESHEDNKEEDTNSIEPAAGILFDLLKKETSGLVTMLQNLPNNDEIIQSNEESSKLRLVFYRASGIWRATTGIVLCSPKFRPVFKNHPIFDNSMALAEILTVSIATSRFDGKYRL